MSFIEDYFYRTAAGSMTEDEEAETNELDKIVSKIPRPLLWAGAALLGYLLAKLPGIIVGRMPKDEEK